MDNNTPRQKKPIFLYIVIIVLTAALAVLGILTFLSLNRLTSLQAKVNEMQNTVKEISESAANLKQQAKELEKLEAQEAAAGVSSDKQTEGQDHSSQTEISQEEGILSPSSGNSFTDNTDESLDSLLSQITTLLPQDNGNWSVYVCNLAKGSEGSINNAKMQAASLIKLFIMGAVYENYDALAEQYGNETLESNLNAMITVSDNAAANTLVGYLGGGDNEAGKAVVNQFCQTHGYADTSMGRMLEEGTENGDNYTSVKDCGAFLGEIYQLCSNIPTESTLKNAEAMYHLLKLQTRTNKIPAQMPEGVHVANKTGELATVENDTGIIYDTANGIDLVVCFIKFCEKTVSRCNICNGTAEMVFYINNRHKIIVFCFIKGSGIQSRSRCHNPHYFPLHKSFGLFRILHLFADGDFISFFNQAVNICFYRMKGNTAHRCSFFQTAVLSRQCNFQFL